MKKSGFATILLASALLPWAAATAVTVGWAWVAHDDKSVSMWIRYLLGSQMILHPAVALVCATFVIACLRSAGLARQDMWWLAGGIFSTLGFFAVVIEGLILDGGYGATWAAWWAIMSGYILFSFLISAYVWDRVMSRSMVLATSSD